MLGLARSCGHSHNSGRRCGLRTRIKRFSMPTSQRPSQSRTRLKLARAPPALLGRSRFALTGQSVHEIHGGVKTLAGILG